MPYSVKLSDGTTEYEFVYNPSSQTDYKMYYGMRVDTGEPEALWHSPDSDERKLIRLVDQPGTIYITQTVKGGGAWDSVINNITDIRRMLNQAARYQTHGDVNKVYCRIQPTGTTNYTDYEVIYGRVDDSGSYYKSVDVVNTEATGVILELNVRPYGEGEAITLRNDLPSSPHFLEDSNSDGLADGWLAVGTPTTGISVARYLIGGKSQQITTNSSSNQGIRSGLVTASSSSTAVAYVWLQGLTSGGLFGDTVTINLTDGSDVSIQSKTFNPTTPTGYDKSIVDSNGTWYRYVVSGTNVNANFRLYITRTAALATKISTFVVDAAYLQTGTTTAPDAWCSTSAIYNRCDPVSANPERINYVDVWGVPGDSDAVVKTSVTLGSVSRTTIIASRHSDGEILAANIDHWIESDELTTTSSSGTWSTGTGTSDNHYQRFTKGGSPGTNSRAYISLTGSNARALLKYPRRLFAVARASSTTSQFVGVVYAAGEATSLTDKTKTSDTGTAVQTVNTWELIDLGLINGYGLLPSSPPSDSDQEVSLNVYVQSAPSSSTNDIDALLLPVLGDEFVVWVGKENTRSSGGEIVFDGTAKAVVSAASGIYEQTPGGLWYAAPGKMNRYVFSVVGSSGANTLADTMSVSFTVYPRTRHLLGTS